MICFLYKKRYTRYFAKILLKFYGSQFYNRKLRQIFSRLYSIDVGLYSYGCFKINLNYGQPIKIGNYCSFAEGVSFIPGNHPINDISTHPFFHRNEFGYVNKTNVSSITIVGNDVWIGKNALILPNCKKIGNGAIIGAGAVVTKDVEPYTIVAGNPAVVIKKRFPESQIRMLEESSWYDLPIDELKQFIAYKDNIELFCEKIGYYKNFGKKD